MRKVGLHSWNGLKGGYSSIVSHWIRWRLDRCLQPSHGVTTSCVVLRDSRDGLSVECNTWNTMFSRVSLACLELGIH